MFGRKKRELNNIMAGIAYTVMVKQYIQGGSPLEKPETLKVLGKIEKYYPRSVMAVMRATTVFVAQSEDDQEMIEIMKFIAKRIGGKNVSEDN